MFTVHRLYEYTIVLYIDYNQFVICYFVINFCLQLFLGLLFNLLTFRYKWVSSNFLFLHIPLQLVILYFELTPGFFIGNIVLCNINF